MIKRIITKELLKEDFKKNQKKINNKKTTKEERKRLIKENQDLLYIYQIYCK